jgi:DNA-binding NtrC family response regulator
MTELALCSQSSGFCVSGAYSMNEQTQSTLGLGNARGGDRQKAILIVEDENLVAWDIEQTLRDANYNEIFLTTSVRGAREIVETARGQLSLVILDLKVDDGDASVLIDEFRSCGIAVLVVTGYSCFARPNVSTLYKPFTTSALLLSVSSLLASRN